MPVCLVSQGLKRWSDRSRPRRKQRHQFSGWSNRSWWSSILLLTPRARVTLSLCPWSQRSDLQTCFIDFPSPKLGVWIYTSNLRWDLLDDFNEWARQVDDMTWCWDQVNRKFNAVCYPEIQTTGEQQLLTSTLDRNISWRCFWSFETVRGRPSYLTRSPRVSQAQKYCVLVHIHYAH